LNGELAALLLLPALSVHVIVPVAELLSGPEYVPPEHPARPEPGLGSLPPPLSATGALYQPAWSAARVGLPPVTVGATESMCTLTVFWSVPSLFDAEHVSVVIPCCDTGNEFAPTWKQFPPGVAPAGTVNVTMIGDVNHPLPGVLGMLTEMEGNAACAIGTSVSETNAT
jgi:hypothetical protein